MKLTINPLLLEKIPSFKVIAYNIKITDEALKKDPQYDQDLDELVKDISSIYSINDVTTIPLIKATRDGYKALKKDPSHTRPACEALLRRALKGIGLYRLGDAIDIGNYLSLKLMRSVCICDMDKLVGDIYITVGENESFTGINRGIINADKLVVYKDSLGIFGSTTSDTMRSSVTNQTKNIFAMVVCFDKLPNNIENDLLGMYKKYFNIVEINKLN